MKTLLKNGTVVNVFTGSLEKKDILIDNDKIIGVGEYDAADKIYDISGKTVCPPFIDSHIHIESTMLTPYELTKVLLPHGTGAIVADPHEIANVCGKDGIDYILKASKNLPMDIYITLPSCVPATPFDESGAKLKAADLRDYYKNKRVLGLAEMMNYPGVISEDSDVKRKISDALKNGKTADGHAPLVTGHDLDKYISSGIMSDHECSNMEEALEKLGKGQYIMIREGTAAKNLDSLMGLLEYPYVRRSLLATDDKHCGDLVTEGHIDAMLRRAIKSGKSPAAAINAATINAAEYFGLKNTGVVAPGYKADLLVLDDLETVSVCDVYKNGVKVVENKKVLPFDEPKVPDKLLKAVKKSFNIKKVNEKDFHIKERGKLCRVIEACSGQLITNEKQTEINWNENNGIDISRDILKIAVLERHKNTGHIGLGFVSGIGLKSGAIASSVSHDSHNIIVIGTNDVDMAYAVNSIIKSGGGITAVKNGKTLCELPLPIAGLMSESDSKTVSSLNEKLDEALVKDLGVPKGLTPFMTMAFLSLPVIPSLKITSKGLVDVKLNKLVPIYCG